MTELTEALKRAAIAVSHHPQHDLKLGYRQWIWSLLGPPMGSGEDEGKVDNAGEPSSHPSPHATCFPCGRPSGPMIELRTESLMRPHACFEGRSTENEHGLTEAPSGLSATD